MRLNYDKILKAFFFLVIIILIATNVNQCNSTKNQNQYYIDKLNARSKKEIEQRELHIKKLSKIIEYKDKLIKKTKSSIDSLEKVKDKIEYVYINKIQQINNYNSQQLENYWKDEIK
jgi:hypothetical protein